MHLPFIYMHGCMHVCVCAWTHVCMYPADCSSLVVSQLIQRLCCTLWFPLQVSSPFFFMLH